MKSWRPRLCCSFCVPCSALHFPHTLLLCSCRDQLAGHKWRERQCSSFVCHIGCRRLHFSCGKCSTSTSIWRGRCSRCPLWARERPCWQSEPLVSRWRRPRGPIRCGRFVWMRRTCSDTGCSWLAPTATECIFCTAIDPRVCTAPRSTLGAQLDCTCRRTGSHCCSSTRRPGRCSRTRPRSPSRCGPATSSVSDWRWSFFAATVTLAESKSLFPDGPSKIQIVLGWWAFCPWLRHHSGAVRWLSSAKRCPLRPCHTRFLRPILRMFSHWI